MPVDILVPPLSQTSDSLVLVEWLKKVGDRVQKGEPIFTVETDKATLEVEAPADGVLESIAANPGDEIQIRGVIGRIGEPDEPARVGGKKRIFASPRARQLAAKIGLTLAQLDGSGTGPQGMIVEKDVRAYIERMKPRATPVAQRMAQDAGLDLGSITRSRPGEVIRKSDVETNILQQKADKPHTEPTSGPVHEGEPDSRAASRITSLTATRRTIANRMAESHRNSAPVTYQRDADATRLVKLRRRILGEIGEKEVRPTITDFLIRITALVLSEHPQINATFDGSSLETYTTLHIALAIDTERGLVAPVITDVGQMGLLDIARRRSELVHKAVIGELKPEEMSGGTFTISNLGTLGIDHFTPIINPPQVAILGAGRVREVPAIHKGKVRRRYSMGLSVTCDHRVIDGAPAARFLGDICRLVENPHFIWL
jgi:pyruvate dehydrogenase E2 component (dihydrolipoamide acetyltransferase)